MLRKMLRMVRIGEDAVRRTLHLHDSSAKLERDAQKFWTRPPDPKNNFWWHWRGSGVYTDQQWLAIGAKHLQLFREWERLLDTRQPLRKVVDWGCGGGANAIAFAPLCEEFYAVDPSDDAINETASQLATINCKSMKRVKLQISTPEDTLAVIPSDIDLFYCLYVFESFPSKEYGKRILKLAHQMLRPGGACYIQIKYTTDWTTQSRNWGYTRGVASMTSYRLDELWTIGESVRLIPKAIHLVPAPPEVSDTRYAYYLFQKPVDPPSGERR